MSATPADDAQTSPAWNCGCKGSELFWIVQIKMPFMSENINGGIELTYRTCLYARINCQVIITGTVPTIYQLHLRQCYVSGGRSLQKYECLDYLSAYHF